MMRDERGQGLIILVLAMGVVFVIGAIVVDLGLWLSERRGSQTDADFSALAGAWQLLDPDATEQDARDAAIYVFDANDEQLNASIVGEPEVDMDSRCVSVDVRHGSRPLFFQIFGLGSPDIGAHAKACAGAIGGPSNLVPFQIDDNGPCFDENEAPKFTTMCPLELGAGEGPDRQLVDLTAPGNYCSESQGGASNVEEQIEWGGDGDCYVNTTDDCDPDTHGPWYDCVAIQTGNPKAVLDGTHARLLRDGDCDGPDAGTVDDLDETIIVVFDTGDPFTSIYEPKDCDSTTPGKQISSRLVTIFVFEDPPVVGGGGGSGTNKGYAIEALAGFYIAGCAHEDVVVNSEDDLDRYCNTNPGQGGSPPGKTVVYGRFVTLILSGGGITPPDDNTTAFGIALVE